MKEKTETRNLGNISWNTSGLYVACGLLMVTILILDLYISLGVAMGVAYISAVLLSLWSPYNKVTILIAVICSIFVIGAFVYKPEITEMWKVIFNRVISLLAIWVTALLGLQRKAAEQKRVESLREREMALEEVRILRGILPICASCKKNRNDQGSWVQIEEYIRDHSEAEFSHGICQECAKKLYPEFFKE